MIFNKLVLGTFMENAWISIFAEGYLADNSRWGLAGEVSVAGAVEEAAAGYPLLYDEACHAEGCCADI